MENVVNALGRASEPDGPIGRHLVERPVAHKGPNIPDPLQSATITSAPVVVIESSGWSGQELHELWAHRDLFYFLAWRDVKVRYQQTILGAAWAILQPLITMVVF